MYPTPRRGVRGNLPFPRRTPNREQRFHRPPGTPPSGQQSDARVGDREEEVRYLAAEVGINEVLFGKSPEEKVEIVREEAQKGPTLFLGDGINDAPAMQAATVGVAFGQNSDITAEAADAVVLETSLGKVDELIHIGRRMRVIGLQSAVGGMALSLIGMVMAAAGLLPPVAGAITQELIDVAAVLNALRVTIPAKDLRDEGI
jgi:cation transport ATPase